MNDETRPTKMNYIRHYRALYDNGCITLDQYGNALRTISPFLNFVDMLQLKRFADDRRLNK